MKNLDTQLQENDTVNYGDFHVRAIVDKFGKPVLKVQTDKGQLIMRPSAGNTVILESTCKPK